MANLFEQTDRHLVPNWRSFGTTTILGELNSYQLFGINPKIETNIDEYIIDWRINQTVIHASDLLSAAIVNNKRDNIQVKNAAEFIISNHDKASKSQLSLANKILYKPEEIDLANIYNDVLPSCINKESIYVKIKEAKRFINKFPYNPIIYVELSRYYSILGQENNSINAMKIALHLAPNNRFILRSATRLFAHYHEDNNDYLEYIHKKLRTSPVTAYDPWLISAEISIATIRDRHSKFIKRGIEFINSNNIAPLNYTELASGIATIELFNGNNKKSKDLFKKALICPNDNSLAQIKWASMKNYIEGNFTDAMNNVSMNFEAMAIDSYNNDNFDVALKNTNKWFCDMPYSKRPVIFGSSLASTILNDQTTSISLLEAGLISHPNDPQLINNLAYALSLDNKTEEAVKQMEKVIYNMKNYDTATNICLTATLGLISFRQGFYERGRLFYLDAIERSKAYSNKDLYCIALLNYAREEILVDSKDLNSIMDYVSKVPEFKSRSEINVLKKRVIDLYNIHKKTE